MWQSCPDSWFSCILLQMSFTQNFRIQRFLIFQTNCIPPHPFTIKMLTQGQHLLSMFAANLRSYAIFVLPLPDHLLWILLTRDLITDSKLMIYSILFQEKKASNSSNFKWKISVFSSEKDFIFPNTDSAYHESGKQ